MPAMVMRSIFRRKAILRVFKVLSTDNETRRVLTSMKEKKVHVDIQYLSNQTQIERG